MVVLGATAFASLGCIGVAAYLGIGRGTIEIPDVLLAGLGFRGLFVSAALSERDRATTTEMSMRPVFAMKRLPRTGSGEAEVAGKRSGLRWVLPRRPAQDVPVRPSTTPTSDTKRR